jgi:hypothetical protein
MSNYERELTLYQMMLEYGAKLVDDLDDARLKSAIQPGANHPLWILGHLAICTDYALQLAGSPPRCPPTWHKVFAPGSDPSKLTEVPSKQELWQALAEGHAHVAAAVAKVDPQQLRGPHQIEFLLKALPSKAELLSHILTTHEAVHWGQLSAWRRERGLPSVL